jgi:hypothetical protein
MKQPTKSSPLQWNLSLLNVSATAIPDDRQRELTLALVELLISAAGEGAAPGNGGEDEFEANR